MTYRVGPKGQVVIPKHLRERHRIVPGDELEFDDAGGEIRVRKAHDAVRLLGLLADLPGGGTAALERERREEREREDRPRRPAR